MGRRYPSQPVAGVGAIVLADDQVLLVRRGRAPQKGLWSIPGGAVELGETLAEAVTREFARSAASRCVQACWSKSLSASCAMLRPESSTTTC